MKFIISLAIYFISFLIVSLIAFYCLILGEEITNAVLMRFILFCFFTIIAKMTLDSYKTKQHNDL